MAGDRGISFPVAALSIVALFVSTVFLGQRAFDLLRLGETDAAKQRQLMQPPVEARLWEDPLAALARHRAKFKEQCSGDATKGALPSDPRCEWDAANYCLSSGESGATRGEWNRSLSETRG